MKGGIGHPRRPVCQGCSPSYQHPPPPSTLFFVRILIDDPPSGSARRRPSTNRSGNRPPNRTRELVVQASRLHGRCRRDACTTRAETASQSILDEKTPLRGQPPLPQTLPLGPAPTVPQANPFPLPDVPLWYTSARVQGKTRSKRAPAGRRDNGWQSAADTGKHNPAPRTLWQSGTLTPPLRPNAGKIGLPAAESSVPTPPLRWHTGRHAAATVERTTLSEAGAGKGVSFRHQITNRASNHFGIGHNSGLQRRAVGCRRVQRRCSRRIGASRSSKPRSATCAAISAPKPYGRERLVHDQQPARLAHRCEDGVDVQRRRRCAGRSTPPRCLPSPTARTP